MWQGQGALTKKIAFRPASLDSKFHKRLTAKIDVRYTKTTKVPLSRAPSVTWPSVPAR